MKFSERWLREWVNPNLSTEALVEQLTMAGLEVDGLEPAAGEFSNVVVAKVLAAEQHPDADKLRVCAVDDGEATYNVVCGAPNARAGILVAFARVGARLPDGMKIRKAKLRGVESFGMLCSFRELGLGDDHDGIIELPESCVVGDDLRATLELDDTSIDIDLTPNRGDCLSLRGIAREVGLLNNAEVSEPESSVVPATIDASFPVTLTDSAGCPRYLGRVIKGIDTGAATPLWMTEKLRRSGIRSIDPTVDITNYVLLEIGQPMHAFDLDVLNGGIDVRMARDGERLTLLDGRDVALDTNTLLITDESGPVALAGVMGGERSGIGANTRDVFLECAYFAPLALAGTARRYGLHTDASQRYERGVDFELQEAAVERATQLLLDICGGEAGPTVITEDRAALPERREVSVTHSRLEQLLGVTIAQSEVDRAFEQLKFPVLQREEVSRAEPAGADIKWTIQAPSHRFDIEREADLVEEVCRVYGYNNIPARQPTTELALGSVSLAQTSERRLRELLADMGYLETVTYSFVDPALQDLLDPGAPTMALENPMSSDLSTMRTTLLPGLLEAMQKNAARQAQRLRVFEVGLCFRPDGAEKNAVLRQDLTLGGLLWGGREPESWSGKTTGVDFFDAKGDVERLLESLGVNGVQESRIRFSAARHPVFHPGQYAELVDVESEQVIGRVGRLHPEVEERMDAASAVYAFELQADAILRHATPQYAPVSKYPRVRRDLALLVAQDVPAGRIEAVCRGVLGTKLVDFTLFDVYVGKGVDSNDKSVAVGLTLQAPSATLTDTEIGQFVQAVIDALANEVGARLR